MSADGIEGQSRAVRIHVHDLSIRHKTKLHQCLEAIADAAHQSFPFIEKLRDFFADLRIAEEGGDELAGSIRFITAGETTRQGNDLTLCDGCRKAVHAVFDLFRRTVADHEDFRISTIFLKCSGGIPFAVRSREYRNQHMRMLARIACVHRLFCLIGNCLHSSIITR